MDKPRTTKLEGGLTTRLPDDFRIEYTEEYDSFPNNFFVIFRFITVNL